MQSPRISLLYGQLRGVTTITAGKREGGERGGPVILCGDLQFAGWLVTCADQQAPIAASPGSTAAHWAEFQFCGFARYSKRKNLRGWSTIDLIKVKRTTGHPESI